MLQPSATDSRSCDSLDAVIAALDCTPRRSGTGYTSRCPAHADRNPSLSLTAGDRQSVVLKCHAGCTYDEIVTALHLERPAPLSTPTLGAPEAVYDYTTYEVVRFPRKRFRQRRPDGRRAASRFADFVASRTRWPLCNFPVSSLTVITVRTTRP